MPLSQSAIAAIQQRRSGGGAIVFHVKTTGPFFQYGGRPIAEATADLVKDITKEGEAKVDAQLYPGHGYRTGEYKRSIHSKIQSSLHGVIDEGPGDRTAIIGKFLEAGRYYGDGRRFKGYRIWRKTLQHLRRLANETAGKAYKRAVKRLT